MTLDLRDVDWAMFLDDLPLAPETACSYFRDRSSCTRYFLGDEGISPDLQDAILQLGFRRCGTLYYRPACPACKQCISYRVAPERFQPSKNLRRVLKLNQDVDCTVETPMPTDEKRDLYLRYQRSQHHDRPVEPGAVDEFDEEMALDTFDFQMYTNPSTTREMVMRCDGRLLGFGTMDVTTDSTSLVYFAFDPDERKRSLGSLNILKSIEWTATQKLAFAYLGYYIPGHPKMDYKARFQPAEAFDLTCGQWTENLLAVIERTL